jgi:hypothetical protein
MRDELRNSFLKCDVELWPDCLMKLLQFVRTAVGTQEFVLRASRNIR